MQRIQDFVIIFIVREKNAEELNFTFIPHTTHSSVCVCLFFFVFIINRERENIPDLNYLHISAI